MAASEETEKLLPWKEKVVEEQQLYYELFGDRDWDCYSETEVEYLERNVGHAVYGPPEEMPDVKENGNTGYCKKKLEQIRKICALLKEHCKIPPECSSKDVWVAVIYVCLDMENKGSIPIPLFRIPHYGQHKSQKNKYHYKQGCSILKKDRAHKLFRAIALTPPSLVRITNKENILQDQKKCKSVCRFVDSNCRVYEDWKDFLENNQLPRCEYCYPANGVYDGDIDDRVVLKFGKTPACQVKNRILSALDTASTVVMVGGMAVTGAAIFTTVAAPLAAAATVGAVTTGVYGVSRSTAALVDRKQHMQSIGLDDAESRGCWLNVVGNSLGMASGQAVKTLTKMAQSGEVLSKTGCVIFNVLNFSSLAVNGLGILNGLVNLREKSKSGELVPLDVFQFASSVLFFTMSAVNIKTAGTIIRETQTGTLNNFEESLRSNRHKRMFRRIMRETQGEDGNSIQGNARVIKGITQIVNKDDFFAGLVRVQKQFSKSNAKVVLTETGLVEINGELHVHPMKFWEMKEMHRNVILDATRNLNEGVWTQERFDQAVNAIFQDQNLMFKSQRTETLLSIDQVLSSKSTEMKEVMSQMNPCQVDTLTMKLCNFAKQYHRQIINIAVNLAEMMGMRRTAEFLRVVGFVANYVEQVVKEVEVKYQKDLQAAASIMGADFNREEFDRQYQIEGSRTDHFIQEVLTNYNTYEALNYLKVAYERIAAPAVPQNLNIGPNRLNAEVQNLKGTVKQFAEQHQTQILNIVISVAEILEIKYNGELQFIADYVVKTIEQRVSELEKQDKQNLQQTDVSKEEFDKMNKKDDRKDQFVRNVISIYEDYDQVKNLKEAYKAEHPHRRDELEAGPSHAYTGSASNEMSHTDTTTCSKGLNSNDKAPLSISSVKTRLVGETTSPVERMSLDDVMSNELNVSDTPLSDEVVYSIAQELTGLYLFEGNTTMVRDGSTTFVTTNDPHLEPMTVMINSKTKHNAINARIISH